MTAKFSLTRLGQLWAYFEPKIIRQIIIGFIFIGIMYYSMAFACMVDSFGLYSFFLNFLILSLNFGPFVFAVTRNRSLLITLPASSFEKAVFIIGYSIVFYPLFLLVSWWCFEAIGMMFGCQYNVANYFDNHISEIGIMLNSFNLPTILVDFVPVVVCLYTILSARRHRVLYGVISVISSVVIIGILNMIYGIYLFYKALMAAGAPDDISQDIFMDVLSESMPSYMVFYGVVSAMVLIFGLILCWRKIYRLQA